MSIGFNCYTENGQLLVSSSYISYHLINSVESVGTERIPNTTWGLLWYVYRVYLPTADPPLVFGDLDVNDTAAIASIRKQGDYWLFNVRGTIATQPSKLKVFGKVLLPPTNIGTGLVVRNEYGAVSFDSSRSPLWITDVAEFGPTILYAPTMDQIQGSLAYQNTNPIFLCNMIYTTQTPANQNVFVYGWKRTGQSTYSSTWLGNAYHAQITLKAAMLVADLV
jgi:hypothetical protein